MSEELIRRSDAIEAIYEARRAIPLKGVFTDTMSWAIARANAIPTIEPKRGKWIGTRIGHYPGYECSLCHYGVQPWNNTNFCPNCGADMREREGE